MENEWLLTGQIAGHRGLAKDNFFTSRVSLNPIPDNSFARFPKFEKAVVDDRVPGGSPVSAMTAIDGKGRE